MNRGEMRTQTRILLGETKQDGFLDTEINTQLDWSNNKVAGKLLNNLTYHDRATEDGRESYPLPSEIISVKDMVLYDGATVDSNNKTIITNAIKYPIKLCTQDEFFEVSRTFYKGIPKYCRVEFGATSPDNPTPGDYTFRPVPNKVFIIRIIHWQRMSKLTDDNKTSELIEDAHMAVCYHAAMILSRKFKDRSLFQELATLWTEEIEMLKDLASRQDQSRTWQVRNVY